MKVVSIENQKVNYREAGNGKMTILCIHGNSLSAQTFDKLLDSDLKDSFKIIAFDLPGCGFSDAFVDVNNYSIRYYSQFVVEIINQMDLKNVILCGNSLGGHIALEAMDNHPEIKGVFVFGTPPLTIPLQLDKAFLPHPATQYLFAPEFTKEMIDVMLEGLFTSGFTVPEFIRENLFAADGNLRSGLLASAGRGEFADEVSLIQKTTKKVAILHSTNDKLINENYFSVLDKSKLWKSEIQFIENGGHLPQLENANEFNKILKEFCSGF